MTERLYYTDSYLTSFDATVLSCRRADDRILVRLDRSAFYPTSGGQPFDTGVLGGARVLDVFADDAGEVWHQVDVPLAEGANVRGAIDWPRRFDHMQQHAGEHMLANAVWRRLGGRVRGLHLGAEVSSVDADLPDGRMRVSEAELRALEADVNAGIQRDVPIVCTFPDAEALARMPLRKPPTVKEHIRVVAIGDFEYVACGGTHPSSAGQIGLLKIVDARPSKGKLHLAFVCGARAFRDYQTVFERAHAAAAALSTGVEDLPRAVAALQERLRQAEHETGALRREKLFSSVPDMLKTAERLPNGARLVAKRIEADAPLLREVASRLIGNAGVAALLAAKQADGGNLFVFARSADVDVDMGRLLSACARANGGKGGGRPDFAQGGGSDAVLESARARLLENIE